MKRLITMMLIVSLLLSQVEPVSARTFTRDQQDRADIIAEICIKEWDTYGVLPSVAISQAFIESTLGEYCSGFNLWGIQSGAVSYGSLVEGVYAYLEVINNGYYPDAPFCRDSSTQIRRILDGGYCEPEGDYYQNVMWTIDNYNLDRYDELLFNRLAEKERLKKQKRPFRIKYDPDVPPYIVRVDSDVISLNSTVCIYADYDLTGIYEVEPGGDGNTIRVSDKRLDGLKVELQIYENAKG